MNHITEKIMNDFFDGSLSFAECNEMREHISLCSGCREKFSAFEQIHQNLLNLEIYNAPDSINSFVLSRILSINKSSVSHKKFLIAIISIFGFLVSFLFWFFVDELAKAKEIGKDVSLFNEYRNQLQSLVNKLPIINKISLDNLTVAALFLFMIVACLFLIYEKMQDVKRAA